MKNEQQRNNRQKTFVLTLAITCLLLFIGVILHMAPTHALASPTVSISPVSQSVVQGNDFYIEVHINSNGESIRTAGFQLTYPTIFTVKSFTYETLLGTSVLSMGAPSPGDNSGLINYAVSRTDGGADPENGKLVTIYFTAPGSPGGPYTLDLHDVILVNGAGTSLTGIGVTDGTVTVISGSVPLAAQCNGPYSGMATSSVSFTGSATGGTSPYTYAWDFNYDGTFNTQSTLQNPTYTYTMAGTYTVALRVTDSTTATNMCTTTATITSGGGGTPTISISPVSQSVVQGNDFYIEVHINSNGESIRTAGFQLTYPTIFTVKSFTYETLLGTSVLSMGAPSPGDNSGLINYAVSRTDGGADPENGKLVTIYFTAPGSPGGPYTLDLHDVILVNGAGTSLTGIGVTDGTVTVISGSVPLAAQCNGPYSGMATSSVSFTGSATGGTSPYTYAWDFNYDGTFNTQSTLQNPTYTYTMAGTYTVALRVTDSTTATNMCTTTATISPYTPMTPPYLQADPTSQTKRPSESFCIDILVNSGSHTVKTIGFQLSYNSTWFTVQNFTYEGLLGSSVIPMGEPSPGDNSGLINYAVSRTDGGADPENGKVATICFTSQAGTPEGAYPLDIHDVLLLDGSSATISGVTLVDGDVTIITCVNTPDVNNDGKVNVLDMILVGQHWGQTGDPGWIPEDINCDGIINILDMIIIGQNWTG